MKFIGFARASRLGRVTIFTALLVFPAAIPRASLAQGTDPNLRVAITRTNQNIILNWFGSNVVAYQVESSTTLTAWTNSSLVVTGSGTSLFVTNPIAGQSHGFYRVKRLIPVDTISASFAPGTGILTIVGDALPNVIVVSRNAAGAILVNGGAVAIQGGTPTVANTALIQVFGRDGNDQISFDETNGALPRAQLFGEAGDDTLTGGSGADVLNGGPGSDTLLGKGGADSLLGGDDNDTVTGGDGDDIAQLGAGNDRFVWNPGDDTDLVEGNDGIDTVEVNGGNGAEVFTATANGTRVRFDRVDPAPFSIDIGTSENLVLNANGGNDSFSATGNLAALIQITVDGGAGDDTLLGSNGADVLLGGDNNDFIDGQQGNDIVFLGTGDDVFQWDPGDGNDTVEGQAGNDRLIFNGSGASEIFDASANGSRVRFTRNVGNIVMDLDDIEQIDLHALGGTDTITVNNLAGTDLTSVNADLAATLGGATGDTQVDTIIVNGTSGQDTIDIFGAGTSYSVVGLTALVSVSNSEGTNDSLVVNALGGNDTVTASTLVAGIVKLTVDGGAGNDTILGSRGADVLLGGDNDDLIDGQQGDDVAFMGAGNDTFQWDPGDGNDVVEGQAGTDRLLFNGSNASENFDASANGGRFLFFRDVANVTMDCDDVENVQINAIGGADALTIGELTSTDVKDLVVNLASPSGSDTGDGQVDSIVLNGTQTNDTIVVSGSPGKVTATGLSAALTITGVDAVNDRLTVNALGAADTVDASGLAAGVINLTLNGGLGSDVLTGSQGADLFNGGDGDDVAWGGGGNDTFVWNPGDDNDTFEGQAGADTLLFNGANVAENIDLAANGSRLRFFRNIANVIMDCAGVEQVNFNALGGADVIVINNLAGTGVTGVSLALGATPGSATGDAQPDGVIINGTSANDTVVVSSSAGGVNVSGLSATVTITGSEGANDALTIGLLAGDDTLDASSLAAGFIGLTGIGGDDDDVLIGSAGADFLQGEDGDDFLRGGPGLDALDGGTGTNTIIQD